MEARSLSPSLRWTWESPGGQFHNEIDHIIFNRRCYLADVFVVLKFNTGSDHRLFRARFRFSLQGTKAEKFKKRSLGTSTPLLPAFRKISPWTTLTKNTTAWCIIFAQC
ncbi:unnamed protein product [Heligmosomoides polygyrus]|uniref:Endo/exonuclease/phosphatase domain-containing protein n=1 Tax=Heligmosomoides polygyrus TaxID=6339 RepID=A0A183FMX0_HELPZ|nr:unnamed protein product [Heligmosomoides polygyrus]